MIQHAKPRGISVLPLHDEVLLVNTLKGESDALRGAARAHIQGIAFPFHTPVAELERMAQQVGGLSVRPCALYDWTVPDAAEFYLEMSRLDASALKIVNLESIERAGALAPLVILIVHHADLPCGTVEDAEAQAIAFGISAVTRASWRQQWSATNTADIGRCASRPVWRCSSQ